jgi:hypothetical protein
MLAVAAATTSRLGGTSPSALPIQDPVADACPPTTVGEITVTATGGTYRSVSDASTGSAYFSTGQNADILVSGIDFNNTGGSQLFNHPAGIASDGTRLAITDTFNNRVLIWNTAPASNVAPDVVLGQENFTTNNPGTGRNQLNFPFSVSFGGGKLFVSDANNHRVLIWNSIPTVSGTPADVIINRNAMGPYNETWPWGIWSDGTKMVVTATQAARILVWNSVPTVDDVSPAFALDARDSGNVARAGTPRHVFSNGTTLWVGDHNATVPGKAQAGTFVWTTFPTSASSQYSFYREDYVEPNQGPWMKGTFIGSALWAFGRTLYSWSTPPASEGAGPDLTLSNSDYMKAGDYGGVAYAGGKLYLASGNANRVVGFNALPAAAAAVPDFTIGSVDYCTNTLDTNYFIQNGVPRSNGQSLFVSSDFDRKLYVWSAIPDQSNPTPDYVYRLPFQPWAMALYNNTLALGGERTIYIWETLPTAGGMPSRQLRDNIGSVALQNIKGVALDATNFYATDDQSDKLYVWSGLPTSSSNPAFSINITDPWRITSDGTYLAVTQIFSQQILIYQIAGLNAASVPVKIIGGVGAFNLPQDAYIGNGRLLVADSGFNRVVGWSSLADALAGSAADLVVGETSLADKVPEIGRDKSFAPGAVWYDGRFLWVGEIKFSTRLMRYSPPCSYHQLSSVAQSFAPGGGTGSVTVTPNDGTCAWTVASSASFVTVTSGSGATGAATVTYSVAPNPTGASRTGTFTAGGRTFTVTQTAFASSGAFTDPVLTANSSVVRAVHVAELRARIDLQRQRVPLTAYAYADATVTGGVSVIRTQHIIDLRAALAEAYTGLNRTAPTYTDPTLSTGETIKAVHITELRAAVIALEGS